MTDEQIKQRANEYADKLYEDGRCTESTAPTIQEIYIAGAHSRDEEFALLKAEIEDDNAVIKQLKAELNKAKNPWVSVDERLPEEGMSVVARNDYGDKGYNHCVCVFKGGKFVVVVTNLTTGKTQEIENNYVKAWMPIPKGGDV